MRGDYIRGAHARDKTARTVFIEEVGTAVDPTKRRRSRSTGGAAPDRDPRARKPGALGYRHRQAAPAVARAAEPHQAGARPDQHRARPGKREPLHHVQYGPETT